LLKIREHGYHVSDNEELVLSNVDKHFDTSVQFEAIEDFKQTYPVSVIHKELKEQVKEFSGRINSRKWLKDKGKEIEEDAKE
jgi:hypothetical protein